MTCLIEIIILHNNVCKNSILKTRYTTRVKCEFKLQVFKFIKNSKLN